MAHDAFLAGIRADPADDLPRLVYADWLDDHGDPARAEFIRVQCELAGLSETDPRRPALEDREHELLAAHEPAWTGFGDCIDVAEWEFRRGFLDQVRVSQAFTWGESNLRPIRLHSVRRLDVDGLPDREDEQGVELFDAWRQVTAGVEELEVDDLPDDWFDAGLFPRLRRLVWLNYHVEYQLDGLRRLATPRLDSLDLGRRFSLLGDPEAFLDATGHAGLKHLGLDDCDLSAATLGTLLAAPRLAGLTELDISGNPLAPDAWRAFAGADRGLRLDRLDVAHTPLAGIGLESLLDTPALSALTRLDVSGGGSARRNLEVLAGSGFWTRAAELRLRSGTVPASTFEPLAAAAGPAGLRTLDLADNYLRADGVRLLCESAWAHALTWLALSRNYLDADACRAIAAGPFARLRHLHLSFNRVETQQESTAITDAGALALAGSPTLARLRFLTLGHTAITDAAVGPLIDGPHWNLAGLGLAGCDLSADAVRALARSPKLARLEWLDLSHNPRLGGAALDLLADSEYLSPVCELDVGGVPLAGRTRAALRARLGVRLSG